MKRRKFIQSSLVAAAAIATSGTAAAADKSARIFGQPTSLTGGTANLSTAKMLLSLSRGGMPAVGWDHWSRLGAAIADTFADPTKRNEFNTNPAAYLAEFGFDTSDRTLDAPSLALLIALSDSTVQDAVFQKDYVRVLEYLQTAGAVQSPKPDVLTKQISTALAYNYEMIKEALGKQPFDVLDAATVRNFVAATDKPPTTADLAAIGNIAELIRIAPGGLAVGSFAVVVAAVEAAIGIHAAVVLFTVAAVVSSVTLVGTSPSSGQSLAFNGQLSRLDPTICDSCDIAQRASAILGTPEIYSEHAKLVIRNEVTAFLRAMKQVGLISYEETAFDTIVDAVYLYGARTISAT